MKDLRDLKDLTIHNVKPIEYLSEVSGFNENYNTPGSNKSLYSTAWYKLIEQMDQ